MHAALTVTLSPCSKNFVWNNVPMTVKVAFPAQFFSPCSPSSQYFTLGCPGRTYSLAVSPSCLVLSAFWVNLHTFQQPGAPALCLWPMHSSSACPVFTRQDLCCTYMSKTLFVALSFWCRMFSFGKTDQVPPTGLQMAWPCAAGMLSYWPSFGPLSQLGSPLDRTRSSSLTGSSQPSRQASLLLASPFQDFTSPVLDASKLPAGASPATTPGPRAYLNLLCMPSMSARLKSAWSLYMHPQIYHVLPLPPLGPAQSGILMLLHLEPWLSHECW